jgi:predicted amidophosphoribosyltransferase
MKCEGCKAALKDDARYCHRCGQTIQAGGVGMKSVRRQGASWLEFEIEPTPTYYEKAMEFISNEHQHAKPASKDRRRFWLTVVMFAVWIIFLAIQFHRFVWYAFGQGQ